MPNEEQGVVDPTLEEEPKNDVGEDFLNKPEDEWTTEDAKRAKKYAQTVAAQKNHWKTKFEKTKDQKVEPKVEPKVEKPLEDNKLKQEQFTEERAANLFDERLLKREGYKEEDLTVLKRIQKFSAEEGKPISLMEALDDPFFKDRKEKIETETHSSKASLPGSRTANTFYNPDEEDDFSRKEDGRLDIDTMKKQAEAQ